MEHTENSLILVACSRGSADDVMATAKEHGARGGTVIKARLAGLELLEEAYDTDLKAEREIVAIVVPTDRRASIMEAVNVQHGLRSPAQIISCGWADFTETPPDQKGPGAVFFPSPQASAIPAVPVPAPPGP